MQQKVNDFTIQVGTVNGSGSQSSNLILLRSMFNMGIPVTGKNLFPSNIAGLPTWFTIRVNGDGYQAGKRHPDIYVGMNPATITQDVAKLQPGTIAIFNESIPFKRDRTDVTYVACPFDKMVAECCPVAKLRKLVVNMIYVGVVAELIGIDPKAIEHATRKQFKGKEKAVGLNLAAIEAGREHVRKVNPVPGPFPFKVEAMNKTQGKILIEGNLAAAIGAVFGGCNFVAWYPITPSSSLCEYFIELAEKYRVDRDSGKKTFAVVQAEDEIASIGMVLGASWAGARAMTSTSGPGISLMGEFAGLGYYAEVPAVIWDIQRVGPSTGLPTRTSQADLITTAFLSHGDTQHVVLLPGSVGECYEFGRTAFDLAERLQTPIFVLSDLDLGMNNWISDPFEHDERPFDRGKVLGKEDLDRLGKFERYRDVDGDGIPYRTIPGTPHPLASFFTRGSGHNEAAEYTESSEVYQRNLDRLARKFETAKGLVPQPVLRPATKASTVGVVSFGSTHFAVEESLDQLQAGGIDADYLRIRALPLNGTLRKFVESHQKIYVVEQNQQGQMARLMKIQYPELAARLDSVLIYDGISADADSITRMITTREREAGRV